MNPCLSNLAKSLSVDSWLVYLILIAVLVFAVWLFKGLALTRKKMAHAVFGPLLATFYMLFAGLVALILVYSAWPGGSISNSLFGHKHSQRALELTLLERQQLLGQVTVILNQVKTSSTRTMTEQNFKTLTERSVQLEKLLATNMSRVMKIEGHTESDLNAALAHIKMESSKVVTNLAAVQGWSFGCDESRNPLALLIGGELNAYNERVAGLKRDEPIFLFDSRDLAVTLVVLGFGALGAVIQGLSSVAIHVGKGEFKAVWILFYISRPFVGAGVALVFYFVMQGGISAGAVPVASENIIGPSAVALLVGLFSGEAMEKLRDVAASLFKGNKFNQSTENDVVILDVKFEEVTAIGPESPITYDAILHGKNFTEDMILLIGKETRAFEFIASYQIKVRGLDRQLAEVTRPLKFTLMDIDDNGGVLASYEVEKPLKPVEILIGG